MTSFVDLKGKRVGRWTVLARSMGKAPQGQVIWRCRCDCGTVKGVRSQALVKATSKSCGCLRAERDAGSRASLARAHGLNPVSVASRLHMGWSLQDALNTPIWGSLKVTEADAKKIRQDRRSLSQIAAEYGVDPSYISLIKNRKRRA